MPNRRIVPKKREASVPRFPQQVANRHGRTGARQTQDGGQGHRRQPRIAPKKLYKHTRHECHKKPCQSEHRLPKDQTAISPVAPDSGHWNAPSIPRRFGFDRPSQSREAQHHGGEPQHAPEISSIGLIPHHWSSQYPTIVGTTDSSEIAVIRDNHSKASAKGERSPSSSVSAGWLFRETTMHKMLLWRERKVNNRGEFAAFFSDIHEFSSKWR